MRKYKADMVPDEHIRMILNAARMAPTCMNQQPWKFLVVRDRAKITRMRELTLGKLNACFAEQKSKNPERAAEIEAQRADAAKRSSGYFTAPVYVVVLVDTECSYASYGKLHDGPLAAGYLMLAATGGINCMGDAVNSACQVPTRPA